MKDKIRLLMACILLHSAFILSAHAQGTAFTYQGRLNSGGTPASGSYDLAFTLFNANTSGVAIAGPVTNAAVSVTNGLFTTTVDFGAVFTGNSQWLELAVSTNGANAFTTLAPRQALAPVPYAIFANTASNLSGTLPAAQLAGLLPASQLSGNLPSGQLNGTYSGAVNLNNSGNYFAGNGGGLTNIQLSGVGPAGTFTVLPLTFNPGPTVLPYTTTWVMLADVNGDGKPDLILQSTNLAVFPFSGGFMVLTNAGGGKFVLASINMDYNSAYGVTFKPAVADFNQDGKMDLALPDGNGLVIYKGNGDGTFAPVQTNSVGANIDAAVAADLNGDGYPDILYYNLFPAGTISSLINFGGGGFTFSIGQTISTGNLTINRLWLADVNGDGSPDLIYCNYSAGMVTMTNHNGLLTLASTNSAGLPATDWVTGDINGDRKPDMILAYANNNKIVTLTNVGGGIWVSNSAFTSGNNPVSIALTTNNTGLVTYLATANGSDQSFAVVANDGHGNFSKLGTDVLESPANSPDALVTYDLNGDGTPDYLFVGNTNVIETFTSFSVVSVTNSVSLTSGNNVIDGFFAGDGSGLVNLSAGQLTGTVPDARLSGNVPLLNSNQTFTGANNFSSLNNYFNGNFNGSPTANSYTGKAGGLTGLNASQLTFGTVPLAVLASVVETNGGALKVGVNGTTFTQIEAGQTSVPTSSTTETNFLINYPQPFSSQPKVVATIAFSIQGVPDVYAINVSSNSPTAFRVNVMRLDTPGGWGQNLLINWQAWQ